jgi:glycosyltransferase involved in cell wall biosynthesis
VTVHDVIPLEYPRGMSAARRALWRLLAGDALRAALVVTDSEASRAAIRAAFPRAAEPLVVYPGHGVAEGGASWPPWPRPALLTVGINKPHKNLETLVRALALVPAERRPLLLSAGPVDTRFEALEALAARHGVAADARALGLVPEERLAALYRSATLFAFPTRVEGFGLPLLEALALGVPAIASDLPVLREIAGDAARWCPSEEPAAWAGSIAELLADGAVRAALARRGLERARAFDYARAAEALAARYQALVPALGGARAA